MKVLTIDIETSPALADVWGLWQQNVGLSQLHSVTEVICFAAKWHGSKKVEFYSTHHDGKSEMIGQAWRLLDEADAIVHWNGARFDTPHLQREFLLEGLTPTSPFREIDLMKTVKKQFRFMSNKLQHVSTQLGLQGKVQHTGHQLWIDCAAGDEKAWALMKKYNVGDVRLTEELYDRLLPWISGHPHVGLYDDTEADCCQRCGSVDLEKRGFAYTPLAKFQQYACRNCGGWSRGKKSLALAGTRAV